jgi:hypothetical protein
MVIYCHYDNILSITPALILPEHPTAISVN